MKPTRYTALIILISFVLLLVGSCSDIVALDGRVTIDLVFDETDFPDGTTLHLSGKGPSTIVQERGIDSELPSIPLELEPGDWSFTITAKDASGAKLGEGITSCKIALGKIVCIAIGVISDKTVTFDLNYSGANAIVSLTTVVFGARYVDHVAWPSKPTRTGYTFKDWNTKTDGSGVSITEDSLYREALPQTLYAQWTENANTAYKVEHYQKDVGATTFTKVATDNLTGTTTEDTAAIAKTYLGFTAGTVTQKAIAGDGTTVVRIEYTRKQYSITFESDGGSAVTTVTQEYGSAIIAPTVPTKPGYTFVSWYPALPTTMPIDGYATTATWTITQYTLTFDSAGGSAVAAITQEYESAITAPADPTKVGYTFTGWDMAIPSTMPAVDTTIIAQWSAISYTTTFDTQGGSALDPATMNVTYGLEYGTLGTTTREGYTFGGWWTEVDGTGIQVIATTVVPITSDQTLYAMWTINQYTLTFAETGNSVLPAITQNYSTAITAPADPIRVGYTFTGWDMAIPSTMPAVDTTITANWTANNDTAYKVEHYQKDVGTTTFTKVATDTLTGATATQTAAVAKTYAGFTAGTVTQEAIAGDGSTVVRIEYTKTQYALTFISAGSSVATIIQEYGTTITAPDNPTRVGHTFAGWDVTIPSTMPAINTTITATWIANSYTLTFDTQGGSALDPKSITYGQKYGTLGSTTREGYVIGGWWTKTDGTGTQVTATTEVTITANQTLYAKWSIPKVGGDGPSGGYIFYDKGFYSDDWRYLEAALEGWSGSVVDQKYVFGYYRERDYGPNLVVGTGMAVGLGKTNTAALVAAMGNTAYSVMWESDKAMYAAKVCVDLVVTKDGVAYDDWFLPSDNELNQMYHVLKRIKLGGFSDDFYWSSSEVGESLASSKEFQAGGQWDYNRNRNFRVRPVRAF